MRTSVILCTYNPNEHIFTKCLQAIDKAYITEQVDEVIIIDNNSSPSLNERQFFLNYITQRPYIKVCHEARQGLTFARLRGIEEAKGSLLIFIDDDNVIYPDFFQNAKKIAISYPQVGAFSGQVFLQFDADPPSWSKRYQGLLVARQFKDDMISGLLSFDGPIPCGAGLCVRKEVAAFYKQLHRSGKRSLILDRSKDSLMSAGDNDLALCSLDVGLKYGLFECLKTDHLIPTHRMEKAYLKRLAYGIYYSSEVLFYMRGYVAPVLSVKEKLKNIFLPYLMSGFDREIFNTCNKARRDARKFNRKLNLKDLS